MTARRRSRLGLRREVAVFLPSALLVLAAVSVFAVASYRQGIERLGEERRAEALRLARRAAERISSAEGAPALALPRETAAASRAALIDASGRTVALAGLFAGEAPLAPLAGQVPAAAVAVGPAATATVSAFVPLDAGDRRLVLRFDLAAPTLAAQGRSARLLTRVVIAVDVAVFLLTLLFLRRVMTPWEALLARARSARLGGAGAGSTGATTDDEEDEEAFLVATFERALAALAEPRAEEEGDLGSVERTLVASLRSGLLLVDRDRRLLAANRAARGLLALSDGVVGEPVEQVLAAHPDLAAAVGEAVRGRREVARREVALGGGKPARTVGLTVHPLRRDDGEVRGQIVLFADLTEARREAEEERLAKSLAELGELAAGLAHEMRNGLATLRGYLTLIARRPGEEEVADYLAELDRESLHLERVLEDFLSFARPGRARVEEIDLERLARRAAADPTLAATPVRFALEGEVPAVQGDPHLLQRAVRNLLANAAQARTDAGAGEAVEVTLSRQGGEAAIAVADRGPGVPAELVERLFTPFATGRDEGVGLGLALAHRIVRLHGGRLELTPREGGGTVATIRLPTGKNG